MVGIQYNSLADLNGQALAWCNKVNGKVHATTNEIPFERLQKEGLSPLTREYIIDKINLRRVQKDCLISYAGNQYSVPAEYIGKDVAVVALDSMLLEALKMKNTLEILDNYQERAVAENLNIVEVLDHIFSEEAKSKRKRAYEKQIQMSGFPIKRPWTISTSLSSPPSTSAKSTNWPPCASWKTGRMWCSSARPAWARLI